MHMVSCLLSVVLKSPAHLFLVLDMALVQALLPVPLRLAHQNVTHVAPQIVKWVFSWMMMGVLCPIGMTCHTGALLRLQWVPLPSSSVACFSRLTMVVRFTLSSGVATSVVFMLIGFRLGVCSLSCMLLFLHRLVVASMKTGMLVLCGLWLHGKRVFWIVVRSVWMVSKASLGWMRSGGWLLPVIPPCALVGLISKAGGCWQRRLHV